MQKKIRNSSLNHLGSFQLRLVKIGELAQMFSVLPSTINFYTREGLLRADGRSQGGYRLYNPVKAMKRLKKIEYLKNRKRLSIEEIKRLL